jgi:hypothetical protein
MSRAYTPWGCPLSITTYALQISSCTPLVATVGERRQVSISEGVADIGLHPVDIDYPRNSTSQLESTCNARHDAGKKGPRT